MRRTSMWVFWFAVVGNVAPSGLFFYALFRQQPSLGAAFSDTLAMAFLLDCVLSMGFMAYLFAKKQIGEFSWPWFVGMTLLGTLSFGMPLFLWLNWRRLPAPRPDFADWWRDV